MKKRLMLCVALILAALILCACRFVVVEAGSVVIEAPTPTPEASPVPEDEAP